MFCQASVLGSITLIAGHFATVSSYRLPGSLFDVEGLNQANLYIPIPARFADLSKWWLSKTGRVIAKCDMSLDLDLYLWDVFRG